MSPLIALMKDQLDMLAERGVTATAALNSTLSEDQEFAAMARIASGQLKIVFVTPEKLEDDAFVAILKRLTIPLFVVDEAHCISALGPRLPAGLSRTSAASSPRWATRPSWR